ncbi:MAG: hypothetical protein QG597_3045 [Actinomycetota bacterium]|nr:hypothetical protein [Actinomycetota bacterium]
MQWVWIVLGVLLVVIVAAVLYTFFVVRPRSVSQLKASAELLARETHGRKPILLVPAKCEAISAAAKESLLGVGVMALTEQGVVFAAANPDRTLIVPRSAIDQAGTDRELQGATVAAKSSIPMLILRWHSGAGEDVQAAFTLAEPSAFVAHLNPAAPPAG